MGHRMSLRRRRSALMPGLLFAVALALVGAAPGARAASWYTVEVLVFERLGTAGLHAESWPENPGRPPLTDAVELSPAAAASDAPYALDPRHVRMGGVAQRLRQSRAYRPILHVTWRQPVYGFRHSRPVHLHAGPPLPASPAADTTAGEAEGGSAMVQPALPDEPALDGTLRLYRARYLHVDADLLFYRPAPAGARTAAAGSGAGRNGWVPTLFRMRQSGKMRTEELYYLDNPIFGVLIEATPLAAGPADTEQSAAGKSQTNDPTGSEPPAEPGN